MNLLFKKSVEHINATLDPSSPPMNNLEIFVTMKFLPFHERAETKLHTSLKPTEF